jgi:cell wall-associated NlpC family hydrolase
MKKKFIATAALLMTLAGCSASQAVGATTETVSVKPTTRVVENKNGLEELLDKSAIKYQRTQISTTITELRSHVGKTWYVFSGASPRGWDCSGLTKWFYEQLGIPLEHRASLQAQSGREVKVPRKGDLVAFYYKGHESAFHVGVYVGNGEMIDAPRPGKVTTQASIADGDFGGYEVRYIRVTGIL